MKTGQVPTSAPENRLTERERWLRRQAMQIVVQLPDEESEALQVLDYARTLIRAD